MKMQIHFATSYGASLINRDDQGFAKRIEFGGVTRVRVSSQCQKRHWRTFITQDEALPAAIRSCSTFEKVVLPLILAEGIEEGQARPMVAAFIHQTIKGAAASEELLETAQPVLIGKAEARYIAKELARCTREFFAEDKGGSENRKKLIERMQEFLKKRFSKEAVANFAAVFADVGKENMSAGVETAMFGRFVTSDIWARTDSAVSVANAMTVHAAAPESDYFSVVDDLAASGAGADHIGESELSAGLFYGYVAIDVPALVANMTGCDPKAWKSQDLSDAKLAIRRLAEAIATVSPAAKRGSTAAFSYSDLVLIEIGTAQNRSLVNAFQRPIRADKEGGYVRPAAEALVKHLSSLDAMYGERTNRFLATTLDELSLPASIQRGTFAEIVEGAIAAACA